MPEPHQKSRSKSSLEQQIDDNLKRVYSDAASEPLPDKFLELLDKLRRLEAEPKNDD